MFELNYQKRLRSLRGFAAWEASQPVKVHQQFYDRQKKQKKQLSKPVNMKITGVRTNAQTRKRNKPRKHKQNAM